MSDFITLIKDNKEAVTFIVAVSGGIGFFLNYFLARKKIKEDKKSIRQQMITNNIAPMRQEWINDVRNKASNFLSICDFIAAYKFATNKKDENFINNFKDKRSQASLTHSELSLYLHMVLPFSKAGGSNEEIPEIIRGHIKHINDILNGNIAIDLEKYENINGIIQCCSNNFKVLFKNEWNETKSLKEIDGKKPQVEKLSPPECTCSVKSK